MLYIIEKNGSKAMKEANIISNQNVNDSRQAEVDFLKVFPLILLPIIHVYENLSVGKLDAAPHTFAEHILQFFCGPTCAPAFMFAMGVGIVYSKNNTPDKLMKRGIKLFIGGYLLNALRSGILSVIATILTGAFDLEDIKYLFLNMDILHFAGLSFILMSIFLRYNITPLVMVGISLIMQLFGEVLAMQPEMTSSLRYLAGHLYKCTWYGCFPLFQWYIFPACGILYGTILKKVYSLGAWYKRLGICAATLLVCLTGTLIILDFDITSFYSLENDMFYNQNFLSSVFALLLICVVLSVSHVISVPLKGTLVMHFVKQMSIHLMDIYAISWLIIGAAFVIFETFELPIIPFKWIIPVGCLITLVTILIIRIIENIQQKLKSNKKTIFNL